MCPTILSKLLLWGRSVTDFIFPRYCLCCHNRLAEGERFVCSHCLLRLPQTEHASFTDNEMARTFWGLVPVHHATSCLVYAKSSPVAQILSALKYRGCPEVGLYMGRIMARQLLPKDFFSGIDIIVPVPLSRQKERQRGYNQSLWIARGVAEVTGLGIDASSVVRTVSNPSQTGLRMEERRTSVRGIFQVKSPQSLEGKHILLIDDVITTGSTLLSCAETIAGSCRVTVSLLTLAQTDRL